MGSFSLSGGVEVFGFISPSNTTDQYPVIDPLYGIDGLRNVDLLSDLDSIPLLRRRAGMVVGVSGTTYYKLNLPPWNFTLSDWSIFSPGSFTGGTVTGDTIFTNGVTANTFSASTYLGLPSDVYVSGYSYSNNTFTIERSFGNPNLFATINDVTGLTVNGDLIVTGTTFTDIISANTISATTYLNLPIDPDTYITGFSYNNNEFVISDNSGNTFNAIINDVTGLTINGNLNVTGSSTLDGVITSVSLSGVNDRMVQVDSGGTLTATTEIINAYISSASTVATQLSNISNWDINGNYIGPTIIGTFQGQRYYDNNYFFEAIQDNLFIRLIRG